jgi:Na+-transporting NADH:ubiquinone oxidoreductase subunit C
VQRSNLYVILYAAALTIVCGVLLAVAAEGLKPRQQANVVLEQKSNILSTVMELEKGNDISAIYDKRVKSYVVDAEGNTVEGARAEAIILEEEYKKPVEQRQYPVYEIVSEEDTSKVQFYVLPLYGHGLWDNIWGFIALRSDLATINGVSFSHTAETPGLGARIAEPEVQKRFIGKKVFDNNGNLASIVMMKGEGNNYSNDPHKVDGMSGATITAKGLNVMIADYLSGYENFLKSRMSDKAA